MPLQTLAGGKYFIALVAAVFCLFSKSAFCACAPFHVFCQIIFITKCSVTRGTMVSTLRCITVRDISVESPHLFINSTRLDSRSNVIRQLVGWLFWV